jgi:hypothetical protein
MWIGIASTDEQQLLVWQVHQTPCSNADGVWLSSQSTLLAIPHYENQATEEGACLYR